MGSNDGDIAGPPMGNPLSMDGAAMRNPPPKFRHWDGRMFSSGFTIRWSKIGSCS